MAFAAAPLFCEFRERVARDWCSAGSNEVSGKYRGGQGGIQVLGYFCYQNAGYALR